MAADWLNPPYLEIPGTPPMFNPALQALVSAAGNSGQLSGPGTALGVYGDSIAALWWPAGLNVLNPDGPLAHLNSMLSGGIDLSRTVVSGVPGNTSAQALARQAADTASWSGLDEIVIVLGANDTATDVPASDTLANVRQIIAAFAGKASRFILCTVNPHLITYSGGNNYSATRRSNTRALNAGYRAMAAASGGTIRVADYATLVTEPDTANQPNAMTVAAVTDTNRVHPLSRGAYHYAEAIAPLLAPRVLPMRLVDSAAETYEADNTSKIVTFRPRVAATGSAAAVGTGVTSGGTANRTAAAITPVWGIIPRRARDAVAWAATTAATVGASAVRPTGVGDFVYMCIAAGTSGSAEPAWPARPGAQVVDGTVTWLCIRVGNDDPRRGYWQVMYATCSGATAEGYLRWWTGNGSGTVGSGSVGAGGTMIGDTVRTAVEMRIQAASLMACAYAVINKASEAPSVQCWANYSSSMAAANAYQGDQGGVLVTPWTVIGPSCNNMTAFVGVRLESGGSVIMLADSCQIEKL